MGLAGSNEVKTGGSNYFKPKEHQQDVAILLEPKKIDKSVERDFGGERKVRDEATCDFTVFATSEALEKGEPTEVLLDHIVTQTMLAADAGANVGLSIPVYLDTIPSNKGNRAYVWRVIKESDPRYAQLAAYIEARDAEPSFDD